MLTPEQQNILDNLLHTANNNQKIWLAGYLSGIMEVSANSAAQSNPVFSEAPVDSTEQAQSSIATTRQTVLSPASAPITVFFGSHSGNSEIIASQLAGTFRAKGVQVNLQDLNDYKPRNIKKEENIILVVSTHGEGEPPIAAQEFYNYLLSDRAPQLNHVKYAVCALGDSSYQHFCKVGADLDERFRTLGATAIMDRMDCDLDFEEKAEAWIHKVVEYYSTFSSVEEKRAPQISITNQQDKPDEMSYGKKNPFRATVLEKILLSGRGSKKENYHIELSLEGSGLYYEPGDALGIVPSNSPILVDQLLKAKSFNSSFIVSNGFGSKSIREALIENYELSVLTKDVVQGYAKIANNSALTNLMQNDKKLFEYLYGRDVLDLLEDFPVDISPDAFISILRKLPPRLYSIASSLKAYPDEVHLTVGAVRYTNKDRKRSGVCSGFIADGVELDDTLPVYIDKNKNFKLPEDDSRPIIMIGPGTGIAPFRAFLQQREVQRSPGKNWLIFGDQHFTTDFLYQTELQKWYDRGLLNRLDLAFSRDTQEKVYVQHRMIEKARELYDWLEQGAYFYVCGDSKKMAPDVEKALVQVVAKHRGGNRHAAETYVHELRKTKRYIEDVY